MAWSPRLATRRRSPSRHSIRDDTAVRGRRRLPAEDRRAAARLLGANAVSNETMSRIAAAEACDSGDADRRMTSWPRKCGASRRSFVEIQMTLSGDPTWRDAGADAAVTAQPRERHREQSLVEHDGRRDGDAEASVRDRGRGVRRGTRSPAHAGRAGPQTSGGPGRDGGCAVDVRPGAGMEAVKMGSEWSFEGSEPLNRTVQGL